MHIWTRNNTRDWIEQIKNRIEDFNYYVKLCYKWCDDNYVYDQGKIFTCAFATCIWVSHQRNERISYLELLEILNKDYALIGTDKEYKLSPKYATLDYEKMLEMIIKDY
jgi:hypothetical protein